MTFIAGVIANLGATNTIRQSKGEVLWVEVTSPTWSAAGPPATQTTIWLERSANEGQSWERLRTFEDDTGRLRIDAARRDSLVRLFAASLGGSGYAFWSLASSTIANVPRWNAVQVPATALVLDSVAPPTPNATLAGALDFAPADDEVVHGIIRLPHDATGDTLLYPTVRWAKGVADVGSPKWTLRCRLAGFAEVGWLESGTLIPSDSVNVEQIDVFSAIPFNRDMQTVFFTLTREADPVDAIQLSANGLLACELIVVTGADMTAQDFAGGAGGFFPEKARLLFDDNPADGDEFTIEVASAVYTFEILDVPTGAPAAGTFEVQREAALADTMDNIIDAINSAVDAFDAGLGVSASPIAVDTYGEAAVLLGIDFLYQTDGEGSREMFRK